MGPQLYVTREEYGELKSDVRHVSQAVESLGDTVAANALTSNRQHNEQLEEARKTTAKVDALANTVTLFIDGHNEVRRKREEREAEEARMQRQADIDFATFKRKWLWIGSGSGLTVIGAIIAVVKSGWLG